LRFPSKRAFACGPKSILATFFKKAGEIAYHSFCRFSGNGQNAPSVKPMDSTPKA
jgi:hypothetical protein